MKSKIVTSKIAKRIYIVIGVAQLFSMVVDLARGERLRALGNLLGVVSSAAFVAHYLQKESKELQIFGEQPSS